MKIAILDDYQDCVRQLDCFSLLADHDVKVFINSTRGVGQLAIRLADFDALVLIGERTVLTRPLIDKLPKLKLVSQIGTVTGHIDMVAAAARNIVITESVVDPTAAAELTWALIMAATRKLPQYVGHLKEGVWQMASITPTRNTLGRVLKGRTLGVFGYGRIGRLVAGYGNAFGMRVVVWGRESSRARALQDGFESAISQADLFSRADIVSLHLRLTEATRGIVTLDDLARMKSDALFVNISHAALIESGALQSALKAGHPDYAALDVFDCEPLAATSPLLTMDNVLASPHLGFVEQDSYEIQFRSAFQNILDFASGMPGNVLQMRTDLSATHDTQCK